MEPTRLRSLDMLKCRIVVRGDLQDTALEESWSPTALFRSLKMFIADPAKNKCRVYQLDFIGTFLCKQILEEGSLFHCLSQWRSLRLVKSRYGMTYSGKYWYLDLKEWLFEERFIQSRASPWLFCKIFSGGFFIIKIIIHVDGKSFFGNSEVIFTELKEKISKRFDEEFLRQAHWYLSARIYQEAEFNVTLGQARYCKSNLQVKCGIDFASCVGALLYLSYTRPDITYAVELAKFTRRPGENHMEALLHLLRCLSDNMSFGLKFYPDFNMSPCYKMVIKPWDFLVQSFHYIFWFILEW